MPFSLINGTVKLNAKIANMQTEPCHFGSRILRLVVSKKINSRLDGIVKMWFGVLVESIGVLERVVEV